MREASAAMRTALRPADHPAEHEGRDQERGPNPATYRLIRFLVWCGGHLHCLQEIAAVCAKGAKLCRSGHARSPLQRAWDVDLRQQEHPPRGWPESVAESCPEGGEGPVSWDLDGGRIAAGRGSVPVGVFRGRVEVELPEGIIHIEACS